MTLDEGASGEYPDLVCPHCGKKGTVWRDLDGYFCHDCTEDIDFEGDKWIKLTK
jgi:predicted amidophosphoribosyltransferase